jgi:PKD repeat protein
MRKVYLFTALSFLFFSGLFSQTMTELVVPKFIGSKSANTTNNSRTAFAVCLRIDGLQASTSYDIKVGVGLVTDPATSFGAGNVWVGTGYSGTPTIPNYFVTNSSGSSGPFWIFIQPTGNGTRFDAGQAHNLRIGYAINGNSMPGSPGFIGAKTITCLDIPNTARTPATTDDGAFVKGSAMPSATGKYVLLFDNVSGTGDPLFSYQVRQATPTNVANTELPALINDTYMQAGTSAVGDYPAVIPIGANNPNGVRRIEARNPDNTVYAFNTDADGIWPSGGNTTTPLRRDVVIITNTDAPLVPPVMAPSVTTSAVTNINYNSATGAGNVTGDGGSPITARGVCWATTHNPTTSGSFTVEPGTTGPFTSLMTGLAPNTLYYVRAYGTNSVATTYGTEVSFTTQCEPYAPATNFWASNISINVGDSINFFDSTLYCPVSWNWSFVGGLPMTSTAQNPTAIHYYWPGVYNVCLTTTNSYGTTTNCKMGYITVNPPLNAKIVITEISYNPPEHGTDSLEYIELYNNDTIAWDLHNFSFSDGVEYTFPAYNLPAGSYVVVAKSTSAMQHTFGVTALQWTSGALTNSGELLRLKDRFGGTVDSVHYLSVLPWDTLANGYGPSLELCDPNADNTLGQNWRHAIEFKHVNAGGDSIWGSPGAGCAFYPVADFYTQDTAIVVGGQVQFSDSSSGNPIAWNWTFQGGSPSVYFGQTPTAIQYNTMGSFDVKLTVTNNWGYNIKIRPDYIEVGPAGISTHRPDNMISISPNPSEGRFTISTGTKETYEIKVLSPIGTLVSQRQLTGGKAELDLSREPSGIYFIRILNKNSGKQYTEKLIIK